MILARLPFGIAFRTTLSILEVMLMVSAQLSNHTLRRLPRKASSPRCVAAISPNIAARVPSSQKELRMPIVHPSFVTAPHRVPPRQGACRGHGFQVRRGGRDNAVFLLR